MTVKWEGNITEHFTLTEYTIGNSRLATIPLTEKSYLQALMMEEFRVWLGRPIYVTCWFRTASLNKKVGGVSNSNHLYGTATDWHTNIKITEAKFIKYAKRWKEICEAHGVVGEAGLYTWGIHFGIQADWQIKINKGKFFNWDSRTGKQKNMAFEV